MKEFYEDEIIIKEALIENRPEAPDIRHKVLSQISKPEKSRGGRRVRFIAAVTAAALILSVAVYAAYSSFSKLIEDINPEISEYLEPVERSCESNGIRMELVGYYYNGKDLVAYVNFEDMEGLGRISEETDIFETSFATVETTDESNVESERLLCSSYNRTYDEETGILTCEYITEVSNMTEFTINVEGLLYDYEYYSDVDTGVDLSQFINVTPEIRKVTPEGILTDEIVEDIPDIDGTNFDERWQLMLDNDEWSFALSPGVMDVSVVSNFSIENVGFYMNQLHVLYKYETNYPIGDYYVSFSGDQNIYLKGNDGSVIYPSNIGGSHDSEEGISKAYGDAGFNVNEADLANYTLMYEGREFSILDGEWEITVPANERNSETIKTAECSLVFDNFRAEEIIVTPYAVRVIGTRFDTAIGWEISSAELKIGDKVIELKSAGGGSLQEVDENGNVTEESEYKSDWTFWYGDDYYEYLDTTNATSITLEDYTIELK